MSTVNWSLQHKNDTAVNWTALNPTLLVGQLGIETDNLTTTPKFKIGDGVTDWNTLPYFYGGAASAQNLNNVLSVGNTTNGNNIVMSGTDVISDSTGTNMFVDLNLNTIYSTDGLNRMAFTADISGKTSEISVRDYSVITLEKGYVRAGITDIYSGVISQSAGWYNQIHTNLNHIEVQSNWANFRGIEYLNDWSANYSLRSLVDKGYVINNFVPYTGATSDVDLGSFLLSTRSIRVTGTAGSGDIHLRHQSTDATATGQSTSLFADVNGNIKYKNDGNYYTTLKTSNNTGDRIYTYPDADGTIALTSNIGTWGALNYPTWVSGTPFVKMTAAGTFALDTNTYLTTSAAASTYQPLDADLTSWASVTRASGFDTFTATPSSANLSSLLTDKTGTGVNVFGTSPTFTTSIITPLVTGVSGALGFSNSAQSSGAVTDFTFTKANHTGQTASTPKQGFLFTSGSKQFNTGALTGQKEFEITSPTYSFVGASTLASCFTFYATSPTAGTNATFTNAWAAGLNAPTGNGLRIDITSSSTGFFSTNAHSNIYLTNTDTTNNNWFNISNYAGNGVAGSLSFQNVTYASSYCDIVLSNRSAGGYTEKMRVTSAGNIVLGNQSALATNATNGFVYIPTSAGAPTGIPTAYTGKVAMQYDTTNNKLYVYNGAWKSVTLA